jgi:two-component system, NtrC family, sensor kinase
MTAHSISKIPERAREERESATQPELQQVAELLRENQKLVSLGRLAAAIAHEINNPLESITNLLYLMEMDRNSPEKWEEYLRLAQRELERVVQISKQTLSFSRETDVPMRVRLHDLLDEVLLLYARRIVEKNIRVVRQYESQESVMVFPGEMRQVLSNLIVNAIEAMKKNGVLRLRLRAARIGKESEVRGIRLSVGDSGTGIPAEIRSRLGEPFFTTKGQSGTGLGLWVTHSILSRYGGMLQLRSSTAPQHHGTVFSMVLPASPRPLEVVSRGGGTARTRNAEFFDNEKSRVS